MKSSATATSSPRGLLIISLRCVVRQSVPTDLLPANSLHGDRSRSLLTTKLGRDEDPFRLMTSAVAGLPTQDLKATLRDDAPDAVLNQSRPLSSLVDLKEDVHGHLGMTIRTYVHHFAPTFRASRRTAWFIRSLTYSTMISVRHSSPPKIVSRVCSALTRLGRC